MAQPQPLTREQAIAAWTQVQQLISVGAYEERSAWHHETGIYPEDGVEESAANLEAWAARQGLEFCYNHVTSTWSLKCTGVLIHLATTNWVRMNRSIMNQMMRTGKTEMAPAYISARIATTSSMRSMRNFAA